MNRFFTILLFLMASCVYAGAQQVARVDTKRFQSPLFTFEREIYIHTPAFYDENDQTDLDVIYVFDSQYYSHFALVCGLI